MNRCPNANYNFQQTLEYGKKNQIGRKFSEVFDMLLYSNYYEGTLYGRYYNEINLDGTSKIYIKDPLEERLQEFCNAKRGMINYLVGFTGMGKTTLLRNFFKVQDRDVHINQEKVIIYISFYYANLNADSPQQSVESVIIQYLLRAIQKIGKKYEHTIPEDDEFWMGLYQYIEENKATSLQSEDITPDTPLKNIFSPVLKTEIERAKLYLKNASKSNRFEYYCSFLKYLVLKTKSIHQLYFVFDDIESKEAVFHRPIVELARHMHSCFSCMGEKDIYAKTLVSLRAYTYRSNVDRQLEARREQIKKNTIFKKETVSLSDIFAVRFQELQKKLGVEEKAKQKKSYEAAVKHVSVVSKQLDNSFSSIIMSLANCNLCNAMEMYNTILVNSEWVAKGEKEEGGGFQVESTNYRLTAKTIFHALACGNEITYTDKHSNYFPNLLYNDKEEGKELFNLLFLRYFINKGACDLYGETYVQRIEAIQELLDVFITDEDTKVKIERFKEQITNSLDYLYDNGILLRSIYDIENIDDGQIERKYNRGLKLYVSPRGKFLLNLFSQNALLLELYRDSIYVDLKDNDKLTREMRVYEVMMYLINYVSKLFEHEKKIIGDAITNIDKYQKLFGKELIISPLLEGIAKNVKSYFKDSKEELEPLIKMIKELVNNVNQYNLVLSDNRGTKFCLSSYLCDL